MARYSIMRYWSIRHGTKVVRISMSDQRGMEYWSEMEMRPRETYPERLSARLDAIEDRLGRGVPGEVIVGKEVI